MKILALHGFTGCGADFHCLQDLMTPEVQWVTPDLAGHGRRTTLSSDDFSLDNAVNEVANLVHNLDDEVLLLGYSMGARVALNYAVGHPGKLKGLVLVGGTPGIEDEAERKQRAQSDEQLASSILAQGVDTFLSDWWQRPLTKTQQNIPPVLLESMRKRRLANTALGLAESLRNMGTGVMQPLWNHLHSVKCPTLLVTGEVDKKFTEIGTKMSAQLPNCKHEQIKNVGHAAHLEGSQRFVEVMRKQLLA